MKKWIFNLVLIAVVFLLAVVAMKMLPEKIYTGKSCSGIVGRPARNAFSDKLNVLSAVWANNGQDKVTQDELRMKNGRDVINSVWDGEKVMLKKKKNEIVSFNLVLESARQDAQGITVKFNRLDGPDGFSISSRDVDKHHVFDFRRRDIEVFFIRYLQIRGVGRMLYMPDYDERHVPERLRLPYTLPKGTSKGMFEERPDANKFYPDIAVPMEAVRSFTIDEGHNQSVWVDIYIPKDAPAGLYTGLVEIREGTVSTVMIPVELQVLNFSLPNQPHAKTMVYYQEEDIADRYFGRRFPQWNKETDEERERFHRVWANHHKTAHRHKISLIDKGLGIAPDRTDQWFNDYTKRWLTALDGSLFTRSNGYDGPGVGVSSGVYSIGTYGAWRRKWNQNNKHDIWKMSDLWVQWFETYAPQVEYFIYLLDEPGKDKFADIERWAKWIDENPGPGRHLKTLVVSKLPRSQKYMPSVDIDFTGWGDEAVWRPVVEGMRKEGKEYWAYNGKRPSTGSFSIEDDGAALRMIGWTHYKHKVGRWFYWHATSYKNPSYGKLETNVFRSAWTFGWRNKKRHSKYGETGSNYSNGDGVLFYPGTERRYREDSYGLDGPIASLRLKHWRRGIQDVDYLTMAAQYDPAAVDALVEKMIPKVLWEVGVTNPKDPTYVHTDISWSTDPDVWEAARRKLAEIILEGIKRERNDEG